jgi:membrane-associated phospholipid phosphatase
LLPQWGNVQPFGVTSAAAFLPVPPPSLDSLAYAEEVAFVQAIGSANSTVRTADQTVVARFWANGGGTATPPGHWNQIARLVIAGRQVSLGEEARMMALLNVALADAAIVCWKAKYEYRLWRPIAAIREAGRDGNAATEADPLWTPLLVTPPFPEYTSGHSTFSGAGATVLAKVFGTDSIAFVGESDDAPGILRPYSGFWAAAEESGMSRIYGGIHFMSANVNGLAAGRAVGLEVVRNRMRPRRGFADDHRL